MSDAIVTVQKLDKYTKSTQYYSVLKSTFFIKVFITYRSKLHLLSCVVPVVNIRLHKGVKEHACDVHTHLCGHFCVTSFFIVNYKVQHVRHINLYYYSEHKRKLAAPTLLWCVKM